MELSSPFFSVVIPYYGGKDYVCACIDSVSKQDFPYYEIIIVDDCSPDWDESLLQSGSFLDSRVRVLHRGNNGGTLQARRDGVFASSGKYILFLDQDDSFSVGAFRKIYNLLVKDEVDILHFPASVVPESAAAFSAAEGMRSFVTPIVRELSNLDILRYQFAENDGFDFHVHHKAIKASLAKNAWGKVSEDSRLALSDDFYICFILDSLASSYKAVSFDPGSSAWYQYHLGRGDTLGSSYDFNQYKKFCLADSEAYRMLSDYVRDASSSITRDDWDDCLSNARDRLVSHSMNEMADNLPFRLRADAISYALDVWSADAVAGELYRYVRDRAYALLTKKEYPSKKDPLFVMLQQAKDVDSFVTTSGSVRYRNMKKIAEQHLRELQDIKPFFRKKMSF